MEYESAVAQVNITNKRKCTNLPWCFVYGIAWTVMFALIVWAFIKGDYRRLHSGADDRGNICGSDKIINGTVSFKQRKYMFPMDFRNPIESLWICVEMCPNVTIHNRTMLVEFASAHNVSLCDYHVPIANYDDEKKYPSAKAGPCPVTPIFFSKPLLHRCSPRISAADRVYYALPSLKYDDYLTSMGQDLSKKASTIGYMTFCALGLYTIYVCVIPCLNIILIKVFLVLITLASFLLTIVLWVCYAQKVEHWQFTYVHLSSESEWTVSFERKDIMFAGIAFTIFTVLMAAVTFIMWRYMPFINAVFKQARTTIIFMPTLLLLPIMNAMIIIGMVLLFGFSFVSTISIVLSEMKKPRLLNVAFETAGFGTARIPLAFLFVYYICLLVWTCESLVTFQCLAISIPVASRLFEKSKPRKLCWKCPICPAFQGAATTIRYHVGSVVMGGAIVALLRIFKSLIVYLEHKAKVGKGKCGKCAGYLSTAVKLVRISNSATMAVIAVDGSSYCDAASRAGSLIGGNLGKFTVAYFICSVYMCIGKIIISITNAFIASAIFKNDEEINNYVTPTVAVGIATYIIGEIFFSVFKTITSTLAVCYCIIQTEARLLRIKYFSHEQIEMYEKMKDEQADPSNTESLVEAKELDNKVRKRSSGSPESLDKATSDGRSYTSENRS